MAQPTVLHRKCNGNIAPHFFSNCFLFTWNPALKGPYKGQHHNCWGLPRLIRSAKRGPDYASKTVLLFSFKSSLSWIQRKRFQYKRPCFTDHQAHLGLAIFTLWSHEEWSKKIRQNTANSSWPCKKWQLEVPCREANFLSLWDVDQEVLVIFFSPDSFSSLPAYFPAILTA